MNGALVLGARGMLGSELVRALASRGRTRVAAWDVDEIDIGDAGSAARKVEALEPETIFNCAAMTDVDGCESDRETAERVNGLGPRILAAAAEKIGALLVHVSTDFVFDGKKRSPYREEDEPSPISAYGRSKLMGERGVMASRGRWIVARTAWLYGSGGDEDGGGRKDFVDTVLALAARGGVLRMAVDQTGSPTYARDLAEALRDLAASGAEGLFHAVNRGAVTRFGWAGKILDLAGVEADLAEALAADFPRPAARPAYSALDPGGLERAIGRAMPAWEDALARYMARRLGGEDR